MKRGFLFEPPFHDDEKLRNLSLERISKGNPPPPHRTNGVGYWRRIAAPEEKNSSVLLGFRETRIYRFGKFSENSSPHIYAGLVIIIIIIIVTRSGEDIAGSMDERVLSILILRYMQIIIF